MKQNSQLSLSPDEQGLQFSRTLINLIIVAWGTYLIILFFGLFYRDTRVVVVMIAGIILQSIPYWFLRRGNLLACGWSFSLNILSTLTLLATFGQGYHDISIIAFPAVIIFTGMTLSRKALIVNMSFMILSFVWLVFGEKFGLFVPVPPPKFYLSDFIIFVVVLLVLAYAVDLLTANMRNLLKMAQAEIIQRKQAEQELAKSEIKYRSLVETTDTGFLILDCNGKVIDANREYVRISGHMALKDIIGRSVVEWTAESAKQSNAEAVKQCLRGGLIRNLQTEYVDKGGKICYVEINATVVGEKDELRIISLCRDITERKKMEVEKEEMKKQLQHAQKMESIGTLAGGVAHEINNPMTVILGFSDILNKKAGADHPFSADLSKIKREALRCKKIIDDLLVFSRSGRAGFELGDVNEMIEGALSLVLIQNNAKDIEIIREFDAKLPKIPMSQSQMQGVLINLYNNASDAMPEKGGRLIIKTEKLAKSVLLSVRDNGSGMPPEVMEKIFEPFYTTKEVGKGTGLGLSLVYEIIKKHGAEIKVESEVGKGTIFTIKLLLF